MWLEWCASENHILFDAHHFFLQRILSTCVTHHASNLKLPSQFSALAPKVWEFFEQRAFGGVVKMDSPAIVKAMNHRVSGYVVLDVFGKALKDRIIEQLEPTIEYGAPPNCKVERAYFRQARYRSRFSPWHDRT